MHQTHNANRLCQEDDTFTAGDRVYVSLSDLSLPKGQATKLLPKYVGPFRVLEAHLHTSSYKIKLPSQLQARRLHDRFHRSKLCPYHANDDTLFPHREAHMPYDFGSLDDQESLVEDIIAHKWENNRLTFQIHWNDGDITWESYETCKDLQALDEYLQLMGVKEPTDLPHRSISS